MTFIQGEALDVNGAMVLAWGFMLGDLFIVNPYASSCGRFHAAPSAYGLTDREARELADLNAGRDLLAYWDL